MTNTELTTLLEETKASAVMITENIFGESSEEYIAAMVAIANNESSRTPQSALQAKEACFAYLLSAPELAIKEITKRLEARSNPAPLSEAAQRVLRGED